MAEKKTKAKPVKGRIKDIPMELIDEPKEDIRRWISQEHIDNLAESLRAIGLIHEPIAVEHNGRYEIVSGHCRQLAAGLLHWPTLRCKIVDAEEVEREFFKLHENLYRQDLSAVEKAEGLHRVKTKYQLKDDELAQRFGMSRSWATRILQALKWPDDIKEANLDGVLGYEVSDILRKIADGSVRKMYIRYAVQDGCTKRLARQWYDGWLRNERIKENLHAREEQPEGHPLVQSDEELLEDARRQQQTVTQQRLEGIKKRCSICGHDFSQDKMTSWDLCPDCVQFLYDQVQDRMNRSVQPAQGE